MGKCFPIFSRAAVPRRQPDASEGAKNRLTVFTFASDPEIPWRSARADTECRRASDVVRPSRPRTRES